MRDKMNNKKKWPIDNDPMQMYNVSSLMTTYEEIVESDSDSLPESAQDEDSEPGRANMRNRAKYHKKREQNQKQSNLVKVRVHPAPKKKQSEDHKERKQAKQGKTKIHAKKNSTIDWGLRDSKKSKTL